METEVLPKKRKFTSKEYYQLLDTGILTEDDRVELINGEIIEMSPINNPHVTCINKMTMFFASLVKGKAIVSVQNPVVLDNYNEPQPDLVLFKHRDDFYFDKKAAAKDVIVAIEVADSSLGFDRNVKSTIYAQHGISEFWIINLKKKELEQYRKPSSDRYEQLNTYKLKEILILEALDLEVKVTDLIP